ncbi:MAG: hypothetical protein ACR2PR_09450 [Pseudohongiellaceae bacterium]
MITNDDIGIEPDEHEFDWEIIEIYNVTKRNHEKRGALVKYTPCGCIEGCQTIEKFIPIPWHKCTDADHARAVAAQKINSHAPRNMWTKELNPPPPDNSNEILKEMENGERASGQVRDGKPVDPTGSESVVDLPESGGSEGAGE